MNVLVIVVELGLKSKKTFVFRSVSNPPLHRRHSSSSSNDDVARSFTDVVIDPIPGQGRKSAPEVILLNELIQSFNADTILGQVESYCFLKIQLSFLILFKLYGGAFTFLVLSTCGVFRIKWIHLNSLLRTVHFRFNLEL